MANTLLQILKDNISDPSVFFVFPTQVAADSWADALLDSLETGTVAMERFTAWDTFKGSSIRSQKQDRKSIPSVMRKLFAALLIEKNAGCVMADADPVFKSLINPEYASLAGSFSNWIAGLLPQLVLWKKHLKRAPADAEEQDLERLYELYRDFLDEKKLFDPAWETPPFDARGNRYIIFYPEILEDFAEYQHLLEDSPNITLVTADKLSPLSESAGTPSIRTFDNSRAELHALALEIKRAHEEDGIPYEDMAVSIDRDGVLLPYIEREFALYSIPVNCRVAKPLTSRGAGMLFPQIQECVSSNFSFESVKDLLLNNDLPWKEKQLNMDLINFGIRNSCICSYRKGAEIYDVWKESFNTYPDEERLLTFYDRLKRRLESISNAKTFQDIENSYFAFRNDFFNAEAFTEQANNILGRCLKELAGLIDIQKEYPDMKIHGCFGFYAQQLASTEYLSQSDAAGVVLYPYRNAAAAPKARHFVPAAGQDAVTVTYSPLRFLSKEKRSQLGVEDTDVSAIFLKMYGQNSRAGTWYSCAEKSFSGYTLPHSALDSEKAEVPQTGDPIVSQRAWLLGQQTQFPDIVSATDKTGFARWSSYAQILSSPDTALAGIDESALFENGKVRISQSALKSFFCCPRLWYYERCLKLKPFSLEADLMDDVFVGSLYHLILEYFFNAIKDDPGSQILNPDSPNVWNTYLERITKGVQYAMGKIPGSPLSHTLLKMQKDAYTERTACCLKSFCQDFYGCTVAGTEKTINMSLDDKPYMFTGKIDLILRNADGNIVLVDFKTGKSPAKKDCFPDEADGNRLNDFQFAMYTLLWEYDNRDSEETVSECHFYEINNCKKNTIIGGTGKTARTRQDMEASLDMLETYAEQFADAINRRTLEAEVQPSFSDCTECAYKSICRSTFTISGEKSLITATEEQNDE